MGRGHTIPGQPHPSHPAQKGEIMRRSAEPKHLKETDKPKAPKRILAAATVAASAGALIVTATPALAEEAASETAPAKDATQTETAATTTEPAKQTLDEATAAHDKAAADAATAKQDLTDAQAKKNQDEADAAAKADAAEKAAGKAGTVDQSTVDADKKAADASAAEASKAQSEKDAAQPSAAASAEALPNTSDTNDMAGAGAAAALGIAAIFTSLRRRRHAE